MRALPTTIAKRPHACNIPSRTLFFHEQDPKYTDYYERALYNQVLGSKQDKPDAEKPLVTYFIGLTPGHVRDCTPQQGTTCWEGTGMESATKYQDSVYFATSDGSALYVNLYSASTLTWTEKGVTVTQTTRFPQEQGSTLTFGGEERLLRAAAAGAVLGDRRVPGDRQRAGGVRDSGAGPLLRRVPELAGR